MQTITLYSHLGGPNPWKVALIMEELAIPYKHEFIDFSVIKQEPFISVNPNGRVPAIVDPNTGLTLWESGAIVEYLVEQYDKDRKISFDGFEDKYHAKQWLHFQVSGQGPYYGQAFWFHFYHPETVESARERYKNEMKRVSKVLDGVLKDREWLVGGKCSYADLSFIAWQKAMPVLLGEDAYADLPNVKAWLDRMEARETVKKVYKDQEEAKAANKKE